MTQVLSPADIKKRAEEVERQKLREAMEAMKKKESHEEDLRNAFMTEGPRPDWADRLNRAVNAAVERGQNEVMVMRFPATWLTDKGRSINNFEADWPSTLTGRAKAGYEEVFKTKLEPMGYKLKAQILNFPGGMPGEVGLFISW
jgi:hypothetical protein